MIHKCPVVDCEAHFLSKKGLNNHSSLHNSKKDVFLCNVCGLDFNSLSKLKYHKISHLATKKHKCIWCSSKFCQKSDRTRHQLSSCKKQYTQKVVPSDKSEISESDSALSTVSKSKKKKVQKSRVQFKKRLMKVLSCYLSLVLFVTNAMGSAHKCSSIYTCLDCCFTFCS